MDTINISTHPRQERDRPRHVKLTDHFLAQLDRMPKSDRLAFIDALHRGAFDAAATRANLYHTAGAVCLGQSYVVFKIDTQDHGVLAFLTVLDTDKSQTIARRRDTKVVRL